MPENVEARATELLFYGLVQHIYTDYPELDWVYDLIDLLGRRYKFNALVVRGAVNQIFNNYGNKPLKSERAVVLYAIGLTHRKIQKHSALAGGKVYQAVEDYKQDPYPFKLWFTEEVRKEIEKFLEAFKKFNEYGGLL